MSEALKIVEEMADQYSRLHEALPEQVRQKVEPVMQSIQDEIASLKALIEEEVSEHA